MSITIGIFEWLRQCPQLANLWSIGGEEKTDESVIFPQGASQRMQLREGTDTLGNYVAEQTPYFSVYEDFQINCYKYYDVNESGAPSVNINALTYDEVRAICDWIDKQDEIENFPQINENVVSVSCEPFVPQIRYIDDKESQIAYFITLRVRYVNWREKRVIEHERRD